MTVTVADPKGFEATLLASAALIQSAGDLASANRLRKMASIFGVSRGRTTTASLTKLAQLQGVPKGKSEVSAVEKDLLAIQTAAIAAGATKFASLLLAFRKILKVCEEADVDTFVKAAIDMVTASPAGGGRQPSLTLQIREDVVRVCLKKLEESLGHEGFLAAFAQIEDKAQVANAEVLAIAKRFTSERPRSRPKALEAIVKRHKTLLGFRAKADARAGRSAA